MDGYTYNKHYHIIRPQCLFLCKENLSELTCRVSTSMYKHVTQFYIEFEEQNTSISNYTKDNAELTLISSQYSNINLALTTYDNPY